MIYEERKKLAQQLHKQLAKTLPGIKKSIEYKIMRLEATRDPNQYSLSSIVTKDALEKQLKIEEEIEESCGKLLESMTEDTAVENLQAFTQNRIHFLKLQCKETFTGTGDFSNKITGKFTFKIKKLIFDPSETPKFVKIYLNRKLFKTIEIHSSQEEEYTPFIINMRKIIHFEILLVAANDSTLLGMVILPCQFLVERNGKPVCMEIDPYTLVHFETEYEPAQVLGRHGVENLCLIKDEHLLERKSYAGISYCAVCEKMVTIFADACICVRCKVNVHRKCTEFIVFKCGCTARGSGRSVGRKYDIQHKFVEGHGSGIRYCMHCGERICAGCESLYCADCGFYFHQSCKKYIFNSCGISYDLRVKIAQFKAVRIENMEEQTTNKLDDFDLLELAGAGSFGKTLVARHKGSSEKLAIKIIKKQQIKTPGLLQLLESERRILKMLSQDTAPFIAKMLCCFQDSYYFCIGMEYLEGGDLLHHVRANNFTEKQIRFIIAEVIAGLEFLHQNKVAFRDLKLENILLTKEGHVKLCDFGLARDCMDDDTVAYTYCGTPDTIAPEVFKGEGYTRSVDFWALGVILYELMHKSPLFCGETTDELLRSITKSKITITADVSAEAKDFNIQLLFKDPTQRIGYGENGLYNIKSHSWFKGVDWEAVSRQETEPEFVPGRVVYGDGETAERLLSVCPLPISNFEAYWEQCNRWA